MCEEQFILSVDMFICANVSRKWDVWHVWGRRHMCTGFWLGNRKEKDQLQQLVGWSII